MKTKKSRKGVLGLGSVSTAYYLHRIHEKYNAKNEEFSTCPLVLYQVDFQQINPYMPDQFQHLEPALSSYLEEVKSMDISHLLIPNISLHETLDRLESPVHICHAVEEALRFLKQKNIVTLTIFGTSYTMNSTYLQGKFSKENIELIVPQKDDHEWIDLFRKKVYAEKATATEVEYFQGLITKYNRQMPVLLACTELSVFSMRANEMCVDMVELQIDAFLK